MNLPVHQAAIDAHHAGLCPVRTTVDGTKRPHGHWKQYQTTRPTEAEINAWFSQGHPGFGIICGQVSGGVEMLELEGRAVDGGLWDTFAAACDQAGVGHVLDRIVDGYSEQTPSRGFHLLLRVVDGPCLGNRKLARRADGEVLIETRGEGGFVILAPSHGPVHPSGLPWERVTGSLATIAAVTVAERDALYAVAESLDEVPQPTTAPNPAPLELRPVARDGDSWISTLVADIDRRPWGDILGRYGIAHHHDAGPVTYWTRPGKDTADGYSATTNAKGTDRLIVFTSAMPLEAWDGRGPAPSYDRLDVIAAYEYGGDRVAAARDLAGRNTAPARPKPPANIDPETGEILRPTTNLPDEFWQARPRLAHIRQAAHARGRSADAVLVFTLARLAATVHPSVKLPAITGAEASLNFLGAIIARSGAGKSTAGDVARELLPIERKDVIADLPMGSGEGLSELYFEWVAEEDANGKKVRTKKQTRTGAFVYLDEGQALAEMGGRKGATLLPTLRTAWSGGTLGQSNASQETFRVLGAHRYRMAVVVGFQLEHAVGLMNDGAGGTPQRFVFANATDASIPFERAEWPGPLELEMHPIYHGGTVIDFDPDIVAEVWHRSVAVSRGDLELDALDSHRDLVRMKVAGLLAILDDRFYVDKDDWDLALMVLDVSTRVRQWVIDAAAWQARESQERHLRSIVAGEMAKIDTAEQRALEIGSKAIGRAVQRAGATGLGRRDLHAAVTYKHRREVPLDDMIGHACAKGWIATEGERFVAGKTAVS